MKAWRLSFFLTPTPLIRPNVERNKLNIFSHISPSGISVEGIFRFYSGREPTGATGTRRHALGLRAGDILRFCNGHGPTDATGIRRHAWRLPGEGTLRSQAASKHVSLFQSHPLARVHCKISR